MTRLTNLTVGSINAKVGNYKSVAGVIGDSHASRNTVEMYGRYGDLSIRELASLFPEFRGALT